MHLRQIMAAGALFAAAFPGTVRGQSAPPVILAVDIENVVIYQQDSGDAAKFATDPGIVAPPAIRNFVPVIWIADVVAVNGKPAKGTWTVRGTLLSRGTTLSPGDAIADSGASFSSIGCSTSGKLTARKSGPSWRPAGEELHGHPECLLTSCRRT